MRRECKGGEGWLDRWTDRRMSADRSWEIRKGKSLEEAGWVYLFCGSLEGVLEFLSSVSLFLTVALSHL